MITLNRERGALCLVVPILITWSFFPAADAAVTRRASKYSKLKAIVLRWSRTRNRYERQGILAETEAIEKAETECLADADRRLRQAERRREREAEVDQQFVNEFAETIVRQFPGSPSEEVSRIAFTLVANTAGASAVCSGKRLNPEPVRLAVIAVVRHQFTNYDTLLLQGIERHEARALVSNAVERKLGEWSAGSA